MRPTGRASSAAGTIPRAIALERVHVPFVERLVSYPKTVLVMAAALTLVSAWGLRYIQFDYNLLNLQAHGTESVVWEKRILATAGRSGFTALASANSLEELRQKYNAFRALRSVSGVQSKKATSTTRVGSTQMDFLPGKGSPVKVRVARW